MFRLASGRRPSRRRSRSVAIGTLCVPSRPYRPFHVMSGPTAAMRQIGLYGHTSHKSRIWRHNTRGGQARPRTRASQLRKARRMWTAAGVAVTSPNTPAFSRPGAADLPPGCAQSMFPRVADHLPRPPDLDRTGSSRAASRAATTAGPSASMTARKATISRIPALMPCRWSPVWPSVRRRKGAHHFRGGPSATDRAVPAVRGQHGQFTRSPPAGPPAPRRPGPAAARSRTRSLWSTSSR
jgi:hypothetical protein